MYEFMMVVSLTTFTPTIYHVDRVRNYWDYSNSFWVRLSDYVLRYHAAKGVLHPSLFYFLFKLVNVSCVRLHDFLSCIVQLSPMLALPFPGPSSLPHRHLWNFHTIISRTINLESFKKSYLQFLQFFAIIKTWLSLPLSLVLLNTSCLFSHPRTPR